MKKLALALTLVALTSTTVSARDPIYALKDLYCRSNMELRIFSAREGGGNIWAIRSLGTGKERKLHSMYFRLFDMNFSTRNAGFISSSARLMERYLDSVGQSPISAKKVWISAGFTC